MRAGGNNGGNGIVVTYHNYMRSTMVVDIGQSGKWYYVFPLLIGLMVCARFFRSLRRWTRVPMTFWIGVGAGYMITRQPALMFSQVQASFRSLDSVDNIFFVAGVLTTLVYFYFTVSARNRVVAGVAGVGRVFLLVSFGAAFANTVMVRMSLLLGRMQFLLQDWVKIGT